MDPSGWGLIVGAIAALGSVGAALAALYIATRDRKDRTKERAADQKAQAKLVIVEVSSILDDRDDVVFDVKVTNFGTLPILDIKVLRATMDARDDVTARLPSGAVDIIAPDGERVLGRGVRFVTPDGTVVPKHVDKRNSRSRIGPLPSPKALWVTCWVQFADAHGNLWAKSTEHDLEYLGRIT